MSKYPEVITPEVLELNKSLSDQEVLRDIADTEFEIMNLEKQVEAHGLLSEAGFGQEARMANFRHTAAIDGIKQRREFVAFLNKLLEARKVQEPA